MPLLFLGLTKNMSYTNVEDISMLGNVTNLCQYFTTVGVRPDSNDNPLRSIWLVI